MKTLSRTSLDSRLLLGAGLIATLCLGCATSPRDPSPSDFAFFTQYPELNRVDAPPGVFLYANPRKRIADQDSFIVNPAQIAFQPRSPYWLDANKVRELSDFLRAEVVASLSQRYKVVDAPAPGVLRVSVGIADIRRRTPIDSAGPSQTRPRYQPVLIVLISDPNTGEAIALLRDTKRGSELASLIKSDEAAARNMISDWAKMLRTRIEAAQQSSLQSATSQP